jgi:hypothetical protein
MNFVSTQPASKGGRSVLINAITLIALGLSILFLNSWDTLFVRASVGLFWGSFFLILNAPAVFRRFGNLAKKNDTNRSSYGLSTE